MALNLPLRSSEDVVLAPSLEPVMAITERSKNPHEIQETRTEACFVCFLLRDNLGVSFSDCNNSFITPSCPFMAAKERGVRPSSSGESILTSPRPSSCFTTPSWPFIAARDNGVRPLLSGESGLTSCRCRKSFTMPS